MSHYNEVCIEKTTRKKNNKNKKAKNKNFRQNPNYTKIIFHDYTADGIFLMRTDNAKFWNFKINQPFWNQIISRLKNY